jgi:integrase
VLNFVIARDVLTETDLPERDKTPRVVARDTLDKRHLPDGMPFVIEDDGTFAACWSLNQYCIDAIDRRGATPDKLRYDVMPVLSKFTRWLRRREAKRRAATAGGTIEGWLATNGEPLVDPLTAVREDLVAFTEERAKELALNTRKTQSGYLSGFFRHALEERWIDRSPIPVWAGRNTLVPRGREQRQARFLSSGQTIHFLSAGLRGDGGGSATAPAYPERDFAYGALLATTGLRRREGAFLLSHEVPPVPEFPPNGIFTFPRTGKGGVTRTVYITREVAREVELYRMFERTQLVLSAQTALRRQLKAGELLVLDGLTQLRGEPAYRVDGKVLPATLLDNTERARAVVVSDEGLIDPACLFVSRRGVCLQLRYWNQLFVEARDRVHVGGHADRPPQHVSVTPHTLRHSFAVRMLAILMEEGRSQHGDPYRLIANPVLTVKELLGHASIATTHEYLYAATTWQEHVPAALSQTVVELLGREGDA